MAPKQKRPSPLDDPPSASSSSDSDEEQDQHIISRQQQHPEDDEEEQGSSEEQEEDEDEEDEDEEQQQKEVQPSRAVQHAPKNPPSNSHPKPSSSESATESDSGSDSEPDPPVTNSKAKPLASKPMDQTPKPKPKPNLKPSSSAAPTKSASKRPAESNGHVSDPKRPKKKGTEAAAAAASSDEETEDDRKKSGDDSKKLFQRVFSEDDEIAILKGLVEFTSKTGSDPLKHAEAFHDFMKKSLRVDASSNQLKQKVRRLKKKFETNVGKGGKNGEGPSFSKPHDQKSFELSKKVWGNAAEGATNNGLVEKEKEKEKENPKSNGKARKSPKKENNQKQEPKSEPKAEAKSKPKPELELRSVDPEEPGRVGEKGDAPLALSAMIRFDKVVGVSALGEDAVKERVNGIEASKRAELEEKWRELQDAELELYVKRAELIAEQARLMLQAHKSSKN